VDSQEAAPLVYPTKVDAWLVVVLTGSLIAAAIALVDAVRHADTWWETTLVLLSALGTVASVAAVAWPTQYELHADRLEVRSGLLRYRAPYGEIRSVEPSRAIWSAPAWSLDRLWVSPHLRMDGDRLISA